MNPMEQALYETNLKDNHVYSESKLADQSHSTVNPESSPAYGNENKIIENTLGDLKENSVQNLGSTSNEKSLEESLRDNPPHLHEHPNLGVHGETEDKKEVEAIAYGNFLDTGNGNDQTLSPGQDSQLVDSKGNRSLEEEENKIIPAIQGGVVLSGLPNPSLFYPDSQVVGPLIDHPDKNTQSIKDSQAASGPSQTILTDTNIGNEQNESLQPSNILVQHDVQFQSPAPNRQNPNNQSLSSSNFGTVLERTRRLLAFLKTDASDLDAHHLLESSITKDPIQSSSPSKQFRTSTTLFQSPRPLGSEASAYTTLDQSEAVRIELTLAKIKGQQQLNATQYAASYIADSFLGGGDRGSHLLQNTSQFNFHHTQNKYADIIGKFENDTAYNPVLSQPRSLYEAKKDKIQSLVDSIKSRDDGKWDQRDQGTPYYQKENANTTQFQFGPSFYLPNYYPSYVGALSYYTRGLEITKRVLQEHYNQNLYLKSEDSKIEPISQKPTHSILQEETKNIKGTQIYRSIDVTAEEQLQGGKVKTELTEQLPPAKQITVEFNVTAPATSNSISQESQKINLRHREVEKRSGFPEEIERSDEKRNHQTQESGVKDEGQPERSHVSEVKESLSVVEHEIQQHSSKNLTPVKHLEVKYSEEDLFQKFNSRQVESQNATPEVKTDRQPLIMSDRVYVSQDPRQDTDENFDNHLNESDKKFLQGKITESYVAVEQSQKKEEGTEIAGESIHNLLQDENTRIVVANENDKNETEIFTEIEKNLNKGFPIETGFNQEAVALQEEGDETPSKQTKGVRFDQAVIEKDQKKGAKKGAGQASNTKATGEQFASPKGKISSSAIKGNQAGSQPSNPFGNFSGKKSQTQEQLSKTKGGAGISTAETGQNNPPVTLKLVSNAPTKQGKNITEQGSSIQNEEAGAFGISKADQKGLKNEARETNKPNEAIKNNPLAPKAKPQTQAKRLLIKNSKILLQQQKPFKNLTLR